MYQSENYCSLQYKLLEFSTEKVMLALWSLIMLVDCQTFSLSGIVNRNNATYVLVSLCIILHLMKWHVPSDLIVHDVLIINVIISLSCTPSSFIM